MPTSAAQSHRCLWRRGCTRLPPPIRCRAVERPAQKAGAAQFGQRRHKARIQAPARMNGTRSMACMPTSNASAATVSPSNGWSGERSPFRPAQAMAGTSQCYSGAEGPQYMGRKTPPRWRSWSCQKTASQAHGKKVTTISRGLGREGEGAGAAPPTARPDPGRAMLSEPQPQGQRSSAAIGSPVRCQ